jgi:hypothetical protein
MIHNGQLYFFSLPSKADKLFNDVQKPLAIYFYGAYVVRHHWQDIVVPLVGHDASGQHLVKDKCCVV